MFRTAISIFFCSIFFSCGSEEAKRSCSAYISKVCEITEGFPESYEFERVGSKFSYMTNELADAVPSKCKATKEDLEKGPVESYSCSHKINGHGIPGELNYDIERDGSGILKCNLWKIENVFISFNESTEQAFLNIDGQELAMSCIDRASAKSEPD